MDITIFDPAGKEIRAIKGTQDSEIEVDSHGLKVSRVSGIKPLLSLKFHARIFAPLGF